MLELKKITKDYKVGGSYFTALKGIDLIFRNHEFVSILGQSGCGKTTLLNIIGGLDHYTKGDLVINGKTTKEYHDHDWDTYRNHTIGFVFQNYNLIPHQTILKNVELSLSISGISAKERKVRAREALIQVGLKEHLNKKPNQLSGGQCQRVSIARALVNNPSIILADEPTGALDSDTSVQVMEVLKEISKDKLVIMVTHNPELAQKYSTRIVRMLDGQILKDSHPVLPDELKELSSLQELKNQTSQEKQAKMSLKTSISLSASNLMTKKKRTFITSFACSIGIIGISIILSVSSGMNDYIRDVQTNSASVNYVAINETIRSYEAPENTIDYVEFPSNTTGIYPYNEGQIKTNKQLLDQAYISYLEENLTSDEEDKNLVIDIDYTRDVSLNVLGYQDDDIKQINTASWTEMLSNNEFISSQYTVLYDGKDNTTLPSNYQEICLVVDSYNRLSTSILDQLGINYENNKEIKYEELIGKEFKICLNDSFYLKDALGEKEIYRTPNTQKELLDSYTQGTSLKIVSIIRINQDASNNWIDSGIGYTSELTSYLLENNVNSEVVKSQIANPSYDILSGDLFPTLSSMGDIIFGTLPSYESSLKQLGYTSTPSSIVIYPKDFDSKDRIIEVLDQWNEVEIYKIYGNAVDESGEFLAKKYQVEYTDVSTLVIGMMGNIIDIITNVLIAFSSVSLVVSSIMIAIITYASVIERTKEIGILRSLGSRKKDISRVFIAEASIIGLVSSVIALVSTLGINAIINVIMLNVANVGNIAILTLPTALVMIILCVGLNLIASLIPARIASKQDPVTALRTD